MFVGNLGYFLDGVNDPSFIIGPHQTNHLRMRMNALLQKVQIHLSICIYGQIRHLRSSPLNFRHAIQYGLVLSLTADVMLFFTGK